MRSPSASGGSPRTWTCVRVTWIQKRSMRKDQAKAPAAMAPAPAAAARQKRERFGMVEGEGKGRTTGPRLTTGPRFPSNHASSILYFAVDGIETVHTELVARGVSFVDEPHFVADLGTRELWLCFFRDSEENVHALMEEKAKS